MEHPANMDDLAPSEIAYVTDRLDTENGCGARYFGAQPHICMN